MNSNSLPVLLLLLLALVHSAPAPALPGSVHLESPPSESVPSESDDDETDIKEVDLGSLRPPAFKGDAEEKVDLEEDVSDTTTKLEKKTKKIQGKLLEQNERINTISAGVDQLNLDVKLHKAESERAFGNLQGEHGRLEGIKDGLVDGVGTLQGNQGVFDRRQKKVVAKQNKYVTDNDSEHADFAEGIRQTQEGINTAKETVGEHAQRLGVVEGGLNTVEVEHNNLKGKVDVHEEKIKSNQGTISTHKTELENLNRAKGVLEGQIETNAAEHNTLVAGVTKDHEEVHGELNSLGTAAGKLEGEIKSLDGKQSEHKVKMDQFDTNLGNEATERGKKDTELEGEIASQTQTLKSRANELHTWLEGTNSEVTKNTQGIGEQKKRNDEHEEMGRDINGRLLVHDTKFVHNKQKFAKRKTEINDVRSGLKSLYENLDVMMGTQRDVSMEILKLEQELVEYLEKSKEEEKKAYQTMIEANEESRQKFKNFIKNVIGKRMEEVKEEHQKQIDLIAAEMTKLEKASREKVETGESSQEAEEAASKHENGPAEQPEATAAGNVGKDILEQVNEGTDANGME